MADAAVGTPGTSADYVVRLNRSEGSLDIAGNRSYLSLSLYLVTTAANGAGGAYNLNNWSTAYVNSAELGSLVAWQGHYDMRPASSLPSLHLGSWEGWVTHNSDGTKTINFTFGFSGQGGTPLSTGDGSDSIVLTPLPRGPKVRIGGAWKQSTAYVRVGGAWKQAVPYTRVGGGWKSPG